MIYRLAHKGISENKMVNSLAKVAAKKTTHLPPRIDITMSDIKNANAPTTIPYSYKLFARQIIAGQVFVN